MGGAVSGVAGPNWALVGDAAGMGAAAGIIWLMNGSFDTIAMAINNMIGDVSGIICGVMDTRPNSCTVSPMRTVGHVNENGKSLHSLKVSEARNSPVE